MLKGPKNALKVKLFFLNIFYIKIIVKIEKNIVSYIKICKRRTESAGFSKQILNYLMFSFVWLLVKQKRVSLGIITVN